MREILKALYRTLTALITLGFLIAAFLVFWHATPANGLGLVAGLLFCIAVLFGLQISKLDDRDRGIDGERQLLGDIRSAIPLPLSFVKAAVTKTPITYSVADPEVHRLDQADVEQLKAMAQRGEPIDEICRYVDPEFDSRDSAYRQAFQRLVEAMIAQA